METRKSEEGKEGKKRETTDPKLTIFSQRQLPLMVLVIVIVEQINKQKYNNQ